MECCFLAGIPCPHSTVIPFLERHLLIKGFSTADKCALKRVDALFLIRVLITKFQERMSGNIFLKKFSHKGAPITVLTFMKEKEIELCRPSSVLIRKSQT